jgi:hypothetical protein
VRFYFGFVRIILSHFVSFGVLAQISQLATDMLKGITPGTAENLDQSIKRTEKWEGAQFEPVHRPGHGALHGGKSSLTQLFPISNIQLAAISVILMPPIWSSVISATVIPSPFVPPTAVIAAIPPVWTYTAGECYRCHDENR